MPITRRPHLALASAILFTLQPLLTQADTSWFPTTSGNWTTSTNWSSDPNYPNAPDTNILFTSATTNSIIALDTTPITVGSITFDSLFNYEIAGTTPLTLAVSSGNATLTFNPISAPSTAFDIISAPVTLSSPLTLVNNNHGVQVNSLDFTGPISGSQPITIIGSGNCGFTNHNPKFTGPISINNGTLFVQTTTSLGSATSSADGTTINPGAILDFNTDNGSVPESLTLAGGSLRIENTTIAFTNTLTITADSFISSLGGNVTFNSLIGSANLTLAFANYTLQGSPALNTYSGTITLSNAIFLINTTDALGSNSSTGAHATIVNTGSTLRLAPDIKISGENITLNPGGTLTGLSSTSNFANPITINGGTFSNSIFTGNISGTGDLTLNGNVTLGTSGTFSGNISIPSTSIVTISSSSALADPAANTTLNLAGKLKFTAPAVARFRSLSIAGSSGNWTGSLDLASAKLIIQDSASSHAADLALLRDQTANTNNKTVGLFSSTPNLVLAISDNAVRLATFPSGSTNFGGTNNVDSNSILITATYKGDANLDGVVDIQDLTDVANHWQQSVTDWSQGDFDNSNFVDIQDLTSIANNWQAGVGGGAGGGQSFSDALAQIGTFKPAIPTPEPASLAILTLGGLLLTARHRNKK